MLEQGLVQEKELELELGPLRWVCLRYFRHHRKLPAPQVRLSSG